MGYYGMNYGYILPRQASSWCTARSSQLWGAQFGHGRPSQLWSVTDQTFREPRFGSEVRLAGQSDGQTMILWLDMIGFCTVSYTNTETENCPTPLIYPIPRPHAGSTRLLKKSSHLHLLGWEGRQITQWFDGSFQPTMRIVDGFKATNIGQWGSFMDYPKILWIIWDLSSH